ncbi:MAG: exodeoxyribonuclease VII small subunit [Alphaproteobacteria bacterium]|nr:MAG: exodeoxyribonuclease VII small subunit [Alphaproteobacteria bacterium]
MAKTDQTIPEDILAMSFEASLSELESVVQKLESGQVSLEDSIDMYTRGTQLKQHCEARLSDAQARIEKVVISGDSIKTEPANID